MFDAIVKHHPWVEQLTLNKNLKCTRHVDRNEGESLIAFFGDFTGGGLFVETPEGLEHVTEKKEYGNNATADTLIGPKTSKANGGRL